jgi:hypothetical protein
MKNKELTPAEVKFLQEYIETVQVLIENDTEEFMLDLYASTETAAEILDVYNNKEELDDEEA